METIIEVIPTARPSLLLLNQYCLMEIFEFLDIDESINLAKTSNRVRFVADRIFKIRSKFVRVNDEMINKGDEYIDHLFQHIGRHVTYLDFHCVYAEHRNLNKLLDNISNYCKNLKCLICCNMKRTMCDGVVQPAYSFDNVELLTLNCCDYKVTDHFTKSFLESFHRLKSVNITYTYIGSDDLKTIFQNNRSIESFYIDANHRKFNCQLLELIPNVERLYLSVMTPSLNILELGSLLKLNRLTKLRLSCKVNNVKNVLRELATKGLIEELELYDVYVVDKDFFDTLASFRKLELLVLSGIDTFHLHWEYFRIKFPISLPTQLKKLRLKLFKGTKSDLIAMIQKLESIESIDLYECRITEDHIRNLNDVAKLCQEICNIIVHSNRKQRLDVVLHFDVDLPEPPKKYHFESERLRVHYRPDVYNPLGIHFPGLAGEILPINT